MLPPRRRPPVPVPDRPPRQWPPAGIPSGVNWYARAMAAEARLVKLEPQGYGSGAPVLPTQVQALSWVSQRYPNKTHPEARALKLAEEAGEVCGAVVKLAEGHKTKGDLAMELAQLHLCAMALAESAGIDLEQALTNEWERVANQ